MKNSDLGRGLASLGVSAAVIAAVIITRDVGSLWGLVIIYFIYL